MLITVCKDTDKDLRSKVFKFTDKRFTDIDLKGVTTREDFNVIMECEGLTDCYYIVDSDDIRPEYIEDGKLLDAFFDYQCAIDDHNLKPEVLDAWLDNYMGLQYAGNINDSYIGEFQSDRTFLLQDETYMADSECIPSYIVVDIERTLVDFMQGYWSQNGHYFRDL